MQTSVVGGKIRQDSARKETYMVEVTSGFGFLASPTYRVSLHLPRGSFLHLVQDPWRDLVGSDTSVVWVYTP